MANAKIMNAYAKKDGKENTVIRVNQRLDAIQKEAVVRSSEIIPNRLECQTNAFVRQVSLESSAINPFVILHAKLGMASVSLHMIMTMTRYILFANVKLDGKVQIVHYAGSSLAVPEPLAKVDVYFLTNASVMIQTTVLSVASMTKWRPSQGTTVHQGMVMKMMVMKTVTAMVFMVIMVVMRVVIRLIIRPVIVALYRHYLDPEESWQHQIFIKNKYHTI